MKKITAIFIISLVLMVLFSTCVLAADECEYENYIDFEGTEIFSKVHNFDQRGQINNQAILFLPGIGDDHTRAEFLFHPRNPQPTITMDYLNHGKSGEVEEVCWDLHVDSIKAVLEAYGVKRVNLVGHSFGADTAMMFAEKYPEMVRDIVLLDRAYYNFSELKQFNLNKELMEFIEYNPESGLTREQFRQYMDMAYENDISRTWSLKKKVLLVHADQSVFLMLPELVEEVKEEPEKFGLTPEEAEKLPEISYQDVEEMIDFLGQKAYSFAEESNRYDVIEVPYGHGTMLIENQEEMRDYVLDYFKNRLSRYRLRRGW